MRRPQRETASDDELRTHGNSGGDSDDTLASLNTRSLSACRQIAHWRCSVARDPVIKDSDWCSIRSPASCGGRRVLGRLTVPQECLISLDKVLFEHGGPCFG